MQNSLQINSLNELRDFIDKTYLFQQAYNKSKHGPPKAASRNRHYGFTTYNTQHQLDYSP